MKAILIECAWGATRTKDTYLKAKYHSLAGRRGKKRALVAVGHKILIMCYYVLKRKEAHKELGLSYLDTRRKTKITSNYIKRLENLGYKVVLEKVA